MNFKKFWPFGKKEKSKGRVFRGYNAAQGGRLLSDWTASATSMDSELRVALPKIRNRSRELVRNNDYAKNTIRALGTNVIGEGVRMQSQVLQQRGTKLNEVINKNIESEWEKWSKKKNCHTEGTLDLADIAKLCIESIAESGDIFIRFITQNFGDSKVPLALEIIEADQVDDNYNERFSDGSYVKMGVEKNKWGRPIAYHVFQNFPNDEMGTYGGMSRSRIRIPAEEMIGLFPAARPRQTRGVPVMAAAMVNLHHLAGYQEGEVVAARTTASLMGFIESPTGDAPADDVENGDRVTDFEPGVFKYLGHGEKVTIPTISRPGGQFEPFVRAMLRGLSASAGVSYETISRDYSQSNYSSTRQALIEDRDNYKIIQQWFIRHFYQVVFERWIDLAVLSGAVKIKNYELAPDLYKMPRWMPRGWSWIDPMKEVLAFKEAVRCGFMTQSDVIAQLGGDFDELVNIRKREIEQAKSSGLVFDSDASQVNAMGAAQAAAASGGSEAGN